MECHAMPPGLFLLGRERASLRRRDAKRVEEASGDRKRAQPLRLDVAGEVE